MTLNDILSHGFRAAHRRLGSVILDLVWKIAWLVLMGGITFIVAFAVLEEIGELQVNAPPSQLGSPIGLMILARELWHMYAPLLFWIAVAIGAVSSVTWILLEAYFRAGLLGPENLPFRHNAARHFRGFLLMTVLKDTLLTAAVILGGVIVFESYRTASTEVGLDIRSATIAPATAVLMAIGALWLLLTILETLIRSNALDLLATELFSVVGVIVTLVGFEALIFSSALILVATLILTASGTAGIVLALSVMLFALAGLTILHSYLLIVRFSSVGIMRHVTDV